MAVGSYPYASTVCIATAPRGYTRRCRKGLSTADGIVWVFWMGSGECLQQDGDG